MKYNVTWTDLKNFAVERDLSIQWLIIKNIYYLAAIDGQMKLAAQIPIITPTPPNTDQSDFETNFKANGNESPKGNSVIVLGKDNLSLSPFGAISTDNSGSTILIAGTTTPWDIPLPSQMVLRGATFFSQNAVIGDWISVQVVDKDNVTGQGGTPENPTIIGSYAISWYIAPGIMNKLEDVSISESLPKGIYMRINYSSVGTVNPIAIINFISYVGI